MSEAAADNAGHVGCAIGDAVAAGFVENSPFAADGLPRPYV
jgi:hypothetical protein